ncbi:MAG: aa3-type cytochrome oxidase subunit III [Mycobacteriales bacterium]
MAAAPALEKAPPHLAAQRPSIVAVGTIVWLSSELMFFSALFAMYFTIRSVSTHWPGAKLNVGYSAIFTTILVASSFTCQLGVFAAEKGDVYGLRRWFSLTLFMGAVFLIGQGNEYAHLIHSGTTLSSSAYGSVFYITTGFHGMHVLGGLIAFVVVLARSTFGRFTPHKASSAIVVSYYWHFVDVVWIALFTTIYLIQ